MRQKANRWMEEQDRIRCDKHEVRGRCPDCGQTMVLLRFDQKETEGIKRPMLHWQCSGERWSREGGARCSRREDAGTISGMESRNQNRLPLTLTLTAEGIPVAVRQSSCREMQCACSFLLYLMFFPVVLLDLGLAVYHRLACLLFGIGTPDTGRCTQTRRQASSGMPVLVKLASVYAGYTNDVLHTASQLMDETRAYFHPVNRPSVVKAKVKW